MARDLKQEAAKAMRAMCRGPNAAVQTALAEAGALESTLVLSATTALQAVVASAAACSIAHANGDDALVVVDNLEGHLALWKESAKALSRAGVAVTPAEALDAALGAVGAERTVGAERALEREAQWRGPAPPPALR